MRDTPDAVMLFAAGLGTRMRELTRERPKPLLTVAGRTLLDHALDLTDGAGLVRRVVNTHYLGEQVSAHLEGRPGIRPRDEIGYHALRRWPSTRVAAAGGGSGVHAEHRRGLDG